MKAGHRRGGLRGRSDPARRRRAERQRSRSAARSTKRAAASPASRGSREHGRLSARPHRLRHHPRAALRRSHLHRPSRRLLVRGDDARAHRARQHAVPRRQRHRAHGRRSSIACAAICCRGSRRGRRRCRSCPPGARHATLNINGIDGGQPVDGIQTPCVADRCRAVFDRRFLLEEGFDATKARDRRRCSTRVARDVPDFRYELRDLMVVHPTQTPDGSPVVAALDRALHRVLGRSGGLVASPGTYDHKHVARIAGVAALRRLRPGHPRSGAPARRVRATFDGSGERHQGHRAGDSRADGQRVAAQRDLHDVTRRTAATTAGG